MVCVGHADLFTAHTHIHVEHVGDDVFKWRLLDSQSDLQLVDQNYLIRMRNEYNKVIK